VVCCMERVGNKGGDDCGMECQAESKTCGTATLFRHIPPGVTKSVSKQLSRHRNLFFRNSASSIAQSANFLGPQFCTVNKQINK